MLPWVVYPEGQEPFFAIGIGCIVIGIPYVVRSYSFQARTKVNR